MLTRSFSLALAFLLPAFPMDKARLEARVDEAIRQFGVSGRGVVVAIMDRGIQWDNNDFRNPDGTTRIEEIFDLTDNTGANAPNNPYKAGTIYTRQQIDAALAGGTPLAHRDAVGHGTTTTGIAAGNGRNSRDWKYRGEAPKARILVVKIVSGAPAHDDQPAEAAGNTGSLLPLAIDYVRDKAKQLGLPLVMLPNIGSVGGPSDGTSTLAKKIDATVGPGIPGLVFVTGSSDDGGIDNHASATVAQGQSVNLEIQKEDTAALRFDLWYPGADRYDVTITTPTATLPVYKSPATNAATDSQTPAGISYFHYGSAATPFGSTTRREILIDFSGPAGKYVVTLQGVTATGVKFDALLNTINGKGRFLNNIVPGYTVWDGASAFNNIVPNDYVLRRKWANLDGVVVENAADKVNDLWAGSGIGPTFDGRVGIDVSAPGNTVFTTYNPKGQFATSRSGLIQDGGGLYGAQSAVSGASPQVTGIIALMLEMNPKLDAAQVKRILQQSARKDAYTGSVPNNKWGYGKIDALAALTAVSALPGSKPYFSLDKNVFSFDAPTGSAAPAPFTVRVTPGPGASAFTATSSAPWLTVETASGVSQGVAPANLTIKANPAGLAIGDWSGEVTIASPAGDAIPQTVMVHLHVRRPGPLITSVDDGAAFAPGFANGSWVTIRGFDLASTTRIWEGADFQGDKLPTSLDGTSVVVFDRPAYVYFISPTQINVLAPDNTLTNTRFAVVVRRGAETSNTFVANTRARNPEFFSLDGRYVAAVHLDGTIAARPGLFQGLTTRAVKPGDLIQLFGTGCGATDPAKPADRIVTGAAPVTGTVKLTIGGQVAETQFVGLVGSGLCQVNAKIPNLTAGDAEVILQIDTFRSADAAYLTVE